ncbi:unnamed protein product, partial [Polarella glacialis]
MNIWFLNCFEYSKTASTIYFFSSFMSHSCYPNAVWYYRGADHIVRARRQIRPGEEVCISYLSEDDLLQHVPVRLQRLQNTKRFWCTCERCSAAEDPSRGFVCPQCDTGQMYAHVVGTEAAHPEGCRVLSSEFSAAPCCSCGHTITEMEARQMVFNEEKLGSVIDHLTASSETSSEHAVEEPTLDELHDSEDFINAHFAQHALADEAWGLLADAFLAKGLCDDQRRLLKRRCDFASSAYPGLSGAHAWALEVYGDALLHSHASEREPRSDSEKKSQ